MLKLIVLPMMIKCLLVTGQPVLCAVIYGAILFTNSAIFDMAIATSWTPILINLALSTLSALAFFWALVKTEDMGPIYWVTLIVGVALMCFVVP